MVKKKATKKRLGGRSHLRQVYVTPARTGKSTGLDTVAFVSIVFGSFALPFITILASR